jgi:hypothetical protein
MGFPQKMNAIRIWSKPEKFKQAKRTIESAGLDGRLFTP